MGGSFNPIHLGHIHAAKHVMKKTKLDGIWFVPAYFPPHKSPDKFVSSYHRYAMVSLATYRIEKFKALTLELEMSSVCYTIDTIKLLLDKYEKVIYRGDIPQLFFIMGSDSLLEIQTWKDYERLIEMIFFIVLQRDIGIFNSLYDMPDLIKKRFTMRFDELDLGKKNILLLKGRMPDISSSKIRELIKEGKDVSKLVPKSVYCYINKYKLYKEVNHFEE